MGVRMGLRKAARTVLGRQKQVVHECRHCGTTVEQSADTCPCCGRSGVAQFEIG